MSPVVTVVNSKFTLTDGATGQSVAGFDTVDWQATPDGRTLLQFGVYEISTATFSASPAPAPSPSPAPTPTPTPAPSPTPTPTPTS